MLTEEKIIELLNSMIEKQVDSLIESVLQTGVSFDSESPETHWAMFTVASKRAELLKLTSKVVYNNVMNN